MSTKLQIPQLIALAQNAGFQGDDLITAVAVALAESGGDPSAYNPERAAGAAQGKGSFGLWQIYISAHPEFAGSNLFDPQTNAAAAFAVYSAAGNSFRPWSTFKNNAYLANVDAVSAALQPSQDQVATDGSAPTDPTGFTPSGTDVIAMAATGLLALWAAMKIFG